MSETVQTQAANGHPSIQLPINDLATQLTLNGNGDVIALTVIYQTITYIQTITRNGNGDATNISQWVSQP